MADDDRSAVDTAKTVGIEAVKAGVTAKAFAACGLMGVGVAGAMYGDHEGSSEESK